MAMALNHSAGDPGAEARFGAWPAAAVPARPEFTRVRRGYAVDEVDRYVAYLLRLLEERPRPAQEHPGDRHTDPAHDVGMVLMDARTAADRVRVDAEVAAAALVAEAEREAHRLVDDGRAAVEHELAARRRQSEDELAAAGQHAAAIGDATARIAIQVDQWRRDALASLEDLVASIEHWPGEVPEPSDLGAALRSPAEPAATDAWGA